MEERESEEKSPAGFTFQNTGLNSRCKDVFSCLDALEQKHQAFERSRAEEDADSDKRLIHQGPSTEDSETVQPASKPPSFSGRDYHESRKGGRHGHERCDQHQQFRKPMAPPPNTRGSSSRGRPGRGRAAPDYRVHPERWTEYSLADVDISSSSMKKAAFDFLHERRQSREESLKSDSTDLDSSACSKGLFTFKKPTKETVYSEKAKKDTSKKTTKSLGSFEKMEDDDDVNGDANDKEMTDDNLDQVNNESLESSDNIKGGVKRKLGEIDLESTQTVEEEARMETENDSEKKTVFKSKKIRKRNFRTQKDEGEDE